jgi:activating signal cointegrator 1
MELEFTLKGLSLTQPHASLVCIDEKKIETRDWQTAYRGYLAIHAAGNFPNKAKTLASHYPFKQALERGSIPNIGSLPTGCIIGVVELVTIKPTASIDLGGLSKNELAFGDYGPNRFAWFLANARQLQEPLQYKATQRVFDIEKSLANEIMRLARMPIPRIDRTIQICPGCSTVCEVNTKELAEYIQKYNCSECRHNEAIAMGFPA